MAQAKTIGQLNEEIASENGLSSPITMTIAKQALGSKARTGHTLAGSPFSSKAAYAAGLAQFIPELATKLAAVPSDGATSSRSAGKKASVSPEVTGCEARPRNRRCGDDMVPGTKFCVNHQNWEELNKGFAPTEQPRDKRGFTLQEREIFKNVQGEITAARTMEMPNGWKPRFKSAGIEMTWIAKGERQACRLDFYQQHADEAPEFWWKMAETDEADQATRLSRKLQKIKLPDQCQVPGCKQRKLDLHLYQVVRQCLNPDKKLVLPYALTPALKRKGWEEAQFATAHLRCRVPATRIGKILTRLGTPVSDERLLRELESFLSDESLSEMFSQVIERETDTQFETFKENLESILLAIFGEIFEMEA